MTKFKIQKSLLNRQYGHVICLLDDIIEQSNGEITKTRIVNETGAQWRTLNYYCTKEPIGRIDADFFSKLCYIFDCDFSDFFKYMPPEE